MDRIISREVDTACDFECAGRQAAAGLWEGHQVRDWLFVEDHVRAFPVATTAEIGETYNIGGQQMKNIEVVRLLCDLFEELHLTKPAKVGNMRI